MDEKSDTNEGENTIQEVQTTQNGESQVDVQQTDSSTQETTESESVLESEHCKHLRFASQNAISKALLCGKSVECISCLVGHNGNKKATGGRAKKKVKAQKKAAKKSSNAAPDVPQSLWICLKCGQVGCGSDSNNKHAQAHYKSHKHPLVARVDTGEVWCYACDDYIIIPEEPTTETTTDTPDPYKYVRECVAVLQSVQKKISSFILGPPQKKKPAYDADVENFSLFDEDDGIPIAVGRRSARKGRNAPSNEPPSKEIAGYNGIKGLQNLGNTCFFNSVMQNLTHTPPLRDYLLSPIETVPQDEGPLTSALRQFMNTMWRGAGSQFSPKHIFSEICKKAPKFRGMHQQDSHELLHYLLDNVDTEEKKRLKIQLKPNSSSKAEETTDSSKKPQKTYVDEVFGGKLSSTIICQRCHTVSSVHEPFLDLSLPIPTRFLPSRSRAEPKFKPVVSAKSRKAQLKAAQRKLAEMDVNDTKEEKAKENSKEEEDDLLAALDETHVEKIPLKDPRPHLDQQECSVLACLHEFTDAEVLEGENGFGCIECTKKALKAKGLPYDHLESQYNNNNNNHADNKNNKEESSEEDEENSVEDSSTDGEFENKKKTEGKESSSSSSSKKGKLVKTRASKQFLIHEQPPTLILHMNRFMQTYYGLQKISKHVAFPFDLDITPYTSSAFLPVQDDSSAETTGQKQYRYRLTGVVVHGGGMGGGHYVAYVRKLMKENGDDATASSSVGHSQWYYFSDSHFHAVEQSEVANTEAYILFYERYELE